MIAAPPRPALPDHLRLLRRLLHEPAPALDELRRRYGPIVQLGVGPARMAVVGSAATVGEVLGMTTDRFRWGHTFNVLGFVVGAGSMIVSDGDDHRRRRGAVQPAFGRRRLNGWIPMIVDRTDHAIAELADLDDLDGGTGGGDDDDVDLYPVGRSLVFDIAVRAFFGDGLVARIPELERRFETAQEYLESPALRQLPHRLPYTARARVRDDRAAMDAMLDEEIDRVRRGDGSRDRGDVLESLVDAGELSDAEIRDQVITLIGAGFHTTAASLAWTLWRALSTPGLWELLRAEADRVLDGDSPPDAGALARLELADRVVRETLRLHPAGVFTPREATVDIPVGEVVIPAKTLVLWSAHLAGRDPDVWENPPAFDPDRWLDPSDEQRAAQDAAWVPFGRPPRNCIGFAMAHMELVLILARMAQRLDVAVTATAVPAPRGMVVNRPTGGVPARVTLR